MSRNLKIASALIILVLGAVGYRSYLNRVYLDDSIKCRTAGLMAFNEDIKGRERSDYSDPEFYFAKDTSICLYKSSYSWVTANSNTIIHYSIKDVYRNKVLVSYESGIGAMMSDNSVLDLYDKYNEYFKAN